MIRYLPPNGVAGLARFVVRSASRWPRPPAMITAIVPRVSWLTNRPDFLLFILFGELLRRHSIIYF